VAEAVAEAADAAAGSGGIPPILGDLSNKYGDIIGVIIGVIGNVPCITKKIQEIC